MPQDGTEWCGRDIFENRVHFLTSDRQFFLLFSGCPEDLPDVTLRYSRQDEQTPSWARNIDRFRFGHFAEFCEPCPEGFRANKFHAAKVRKSVHFSK